MKKRNVSPIVILCDNQMRNKDYNCQKAEEYGAMTFKIAAKPRAPSLKKSSR